MPARLIHDMSRSSEPDGSRPLEPAAVAADLPVLVVAGVCWSPMTTLLMLAAGLRRRRRPSRHRSTNRVRRRRGPGPDRGETGAPGRRPAACATRSSPTSANPLSPWSPRADAIDLSEAAARRTGSGRRTDQRGSEGDRRIRSPALRPIPPPSCPTQHGQVGSPPLATVPESCPRPPIWSDGLLSARTRRGRAPGICNRLLGNQRARSSGSTSFTTGAGLPHRSRLPRAMTGRPCRTLTRTTKRS